MRTLRFRMIAALVLAAAVATASHAQSAAGTLKLPAYTKTRLPNGMTLLLMEQTEVPIVSFSFVVKAGSVADPKGKEGVAALAADLLRKGTRNRSADRIANELDFVGGNFDSNGSLDFTGGSAEFLKKDLDTGLDLIADILVNPTFPEDELAKLVAQRIDGIKSAKDRASGVIGQYFNAYLFGDHPYGRPTGGDETSLASITRDDVRSFYETYYTPGNLILAVSGDISIPAMREMIGRRFGSWPAKAAPAISVEEPKPSTGRRLLLVDKPDSTQTYFYIGNLGISRMHPDRVAINVINTLFGGRFTSRLNTALRVDSGLTYGASSSFDQRKAAGPFQISTYTRNATTEQAIDMTLSVLEDFHESGISEAELKSAQNYLKGQFPTSIETSDRLASTIARLEFYGLDARDIDDYYARIDAITMDEARRIIREHFPVDNLVFVLIGKASEIQELAKQYASKLDVKSITQIGY